MNMRAYAAELLGTFVLSLVVFLSITAGISITPVLAAITLGTFVYTIGSISGTHINPAVTLALLSIRKISMKDAGAYIVAQLLGGALALGIGRMLTGQAPNLPVESTFPIALYEALGTFLLVFGISSVVYKRTPTDASGAVIGMSLLLGVMVASVGSNGVLNPAVALGIGSLSSMYVLGPILGAVAGAWAYKALVAEQ